MLGKTHVPFGISTALIATHPTSISGVIGAVAGGAIGGWICDIDVRGTSEIDGTVWGTVFMTLTASIALCVDYAIGDGICDYMVESWGILKIIALILFIAGCIYGFTTAHRSIMHSFLGLAVFSILMFVICAPLALPFAVGYVSHIFLDLFNKRGMQLFFPAKKRFSWNLCDSNGKANNVIGGFSVILALVLTVGFGFVAMSNESSARSIIDSSMQAIEGHMISPLTGYLILINIITFIAYSIDFALCYHGVISDENEEGVHEFLNFFAYIGGAFGALVALLLYTKKGRDNAFWFVNIISVLLAWIIIILIVYDPFQMQWGINKDILSHIPLIAYLIFINTLSVILFVRDRAKRRSDVNRNEFILLVVGFLGGAIGGYIVMIFTNGKRNFSHFAIGFPIMIALHTFIIAFLLCTGIA